MTADLWFLLGGVLLFVVAFIGARARNRARRPVYRPPPVPLCLGCQVRLESDGIVYLLDLEGGSRRPCVMCGTFTLYRTAGRAP